MENQKNSAITVKGKPDWEAESSKTIYSLGTSVRERDQLIRLLRIFRINRLVDVRRFPANRLAYFHKDKV